MKSLFNADLICRDFGRSAVRVRDLLQWVESIDASLPATTPDVREYELAHLETLLCAMERAVPGMSNRAVIEASADMPCDPRLRQLIDDPDEPCATSARWVVGANIHRLWRNRIERALRDGELRPVDVLTGMPIAFEPAGLPTRPEQRRVPTRAASSLTTDEVIEALRGVGMNGLAWRRQLTKNRPGWLMACRLDRGSQGQRQTTWDALKIACALASGKCRLSGAVPVADLDRAFGQLPLRHLSEAWKALRADHPEWDA